MSRLSILLAAALVVGSLAAWGEFQRQGRLDALRDLTAAQAEIATLAAARQQAQDAAAELDKHLRRTAEARDAWAAIARETDNLEGADEPLSPYLRGVLDRVR